MQITDKKQGVASRAIADATQANRAISMPAVPVLQNKTPENEALQTEHGDGEPVYQPAAKSTNNTGLPDNLKSGVESLSGQSLDDVKVHYNSDKPVQLQALAYAQGTDIHVGPGQEKHLPHEAWHVVQQKQGRVQPTIQAKGRPVNDDKGLEQEADVMGEKAIQTTVDSAFIPPKANTAQGTQPVQRLIADDTDTLHAPKAWMDTKPDGHTETLGKISADFSNDLREELVANIKSITTIEPAAFKQIDPATDTVKNLKDEITRKLDETAFDALAAGKAAAFTKIKGIFAGALTNQYSVNKVPEAITPTTTLADFNPRPLIAPQGLIKAASDLGDEYEINKICSLIALYKGEGSNADLKRELGLRGSPPRTEYYKALHEYYRGEAIEYDEPSTHVAMYGKWGYSIIFAGDVSFENLPTALGKTLATGKKYIFDITGHTVFVTMKKDMAPGVAIGRDKIDSYFNFNSDGANFSEKEKDRNVGNIYEK